MQIKEIKSRHNQDYFNPYSCFHTFISKIFRPSNIAKVLEKSALKYPDKYAVIYDNSRITFNQLKEKSAHLESGLRSLGITKGDWVAVMLSNCPQFVISFLAIAGIGAIVVPVDIYYRRHELESLFRDVHIKALITSPDFLDIVEPSICNCSDFRHLILTESNSNEYLCLEDLLKSEDLLKRIPSKIKPEDDLLYLYTSGTTGRPKGVVLSHEKAIEIGRSWRNRSSITDNDTCYTLAPLFRSPALLSVMVAGIYYAIPMVISPTFCVQKVWDIIKSEHVTYFHANPFHFAALANLPVEKNLKYPALKLCYSSGNRLSPKVARKFFYKFGIRIEERYGTLEVGGICKNGYPLKGVGIKLIDKKGKQIKEKDRKGEIIVRTPMMVKKYHTLSDLSDKVFRDGWFHTGDIGKIDQNGKLHILYRMKTAFLISGKEVYPDKIEKVLRGHPKIQDVLVIKEKLNPDYFSIKAIIVLKGKCSHEILLNYCRSRLSNHEIPSLFEFRKELPRSWKKVIGGSGPAYPMWGEF